MKLATPEVPEVSNLIKPRMIVRSVLSADLGVDEFKLPSGEHTKSNGTWP